MESNSPNVWVLLLQPKAYSRVSEHSAQKEESHREAKVRLNASVHQNHLGTFNKCSLGIYPGTVK